MHSVPDGPAAVATGGTQQSPARLLCDGAPSLAVLAECLQAELPETGFAQCAEPGPGIESDWRKTVRYMLGGRCDASLLPASLAEIYDLGTLLDKGNGRAYCVLMEAQDADRNGKADRGWGTLVVSLHPDRELGIQVPHPVDEAGTLQEGFEIFRETGAWYLLLAGAGRNASRDTSTCQAAFGRADVTHNVDNLFQATVEEAASVATERGVELVNLQVHGMAASTCRGVDVLMSYGTDGLPSAASRLPALQKALQADNPHWAVKVSGDSPDCEVEGTLNVQGRLLNGVPADAVCKVAASRATGRFIHIEQKSKVRDAGHWIKAIQSTFPEIAR